jgi:hypothetical protein
MDSKGDETPVSKLKRMMIRMIMQVREGRQKQVNSK